MERRHSQARPQQEPCLQHLSVWPTPGPGWGSLRTIGNKDWRWGQGDGSKLVPAPPSSSPHTPGQLPASPKARLIMLSIQPPPLPLTGHLQRENLGYRRERAVRALEPRAPLHGLDRVELFETAQCRRRPGLPSLWVCVPDMLGSSLSLGVSLED